MFNCIPWGPLYDVFAQLFSLIVRNIACKVYQNILQGVSRHKRIPKHGTIFYLGVKLDILRFLHFLRYISSEHLSQKQIL